MYRDKGAIRRRRIEQLNTRAQQKSERGQKRERRMIYVKAAIRLKRNEKRTKQSAKHKNENSNTHGEIKKPKTNVLESRSCRYHRHRLR